MSGAQLAASVADPAEQAAPVQPADLVSLFLLIATRDRTGRPMGYHRYGFGAAVLAEMALQGHVRLERKRVHAGPPPQDLLYATVWHDIRSVRTRKASWWVSRISGGRYKLLRRQFTQRLVDGGMLVESPSLFGIRYPNRGSGIEAALRTRIADAVITHDTSDRRLVCLVAITVAAGSSAEIHPEWRMRRKIRRAARRWVKSDAFAKAVGELIATITAAVVASSVAVSSVS